jgi:CheY-like chemotaxis protein
MENKTNQYIFITDDDQDDREFLKIALSNVGYTGNVKLFDNGGRLFTHLLANPEGLPDAIVLDINMPIKDGYETLEALKQAEQFKAINVIMLTSSVRKQDETKCRGLGCADYYSKPSSLAGFNAIASSIIACLPNK